MKTLARLLLLLAWVAIGVPAARAQGGPAVLATDKARVSVVLESTKAEVGERIPARVVFSGAESPDRIELTVPAEFATTAFIEPVEFDGRDFRTGVRPLKDGTHAVGPVKAKLKYADGRIEEVEAGVLGLEVAAPVVPEGETKDLTPPVELPFDWTWRNLAIAAAFLLLLGALGLIGWALSRRKPALAPAPAAVVLPPLEEARRALGELATMKLFRTAGGEQHYTALSMLLRRYIEREFRIPALEMTDDEVIRFIRRDLANHAGTAPLPDLFTRSSMAKFARMELTTDIASSDCAVAGEFLDAEGQRKERERVAMQGAAQKQRAPGAAA